MGQPGWRRLERRPALYGFGNEVAGQKSSLEKQCLHRSVTRDLGKAPLLEVTFIKTLVIRKKLLWYHARFAAARSG